MQIAPVNVEFFRSGEIARVQRRDAVFDGDFLIAAPQFVIFFGCFRNFSFASGVWTTTCSLNDGALNSTVSCAGLCIVKIGGKNFSFLPAEKIKLIFAATEINSGVNHIRVIADVERRGVTVRKVVIFVADKIAFSLRLANFNAGAEVRIQLKEITDFVRL